eukprot:s7867_g3.t1
MVIKAIQPKPLTCPASRSDLRKWAKHASMGSAQGTLPNGITHIQPSEASTAQMPGTICHAGSIINALLPPLPNKYQLDDSIGNTPTTGSWQVGLGGVIINERGTRLGHFSEFASPAVIAKVNPDSGNPIVEIECFAMYIALHLWHKLALGTNTVIFTDNEGALVKHTHELCDNSHLNLWFERVNTHANIADAPSRGVSNDELGKRFEVNLEDEVADIALSRGGL